MEFNIDYLDYCNFVKKLDDSLKEQFGDDPSSCWLFAYYFHSKYNLPILDNEPIYKNNFDLTNITLNNGIYSFFTENKTEFHHFVIIVVDDTIKLFSTYGGQLGMIRIIHTKEQFINLLKKIYLNDKIHLNDKISYYKNLYGISVRVDTLDISNYNFSYSYSCKI